MDSRHILLFMCIAITLGASAAVCIGDTFRSFPLRNGDFSFVSRPWGMPANWRTMVWSGQHTFSLDPVPTGPQNSPSTAVITAAAHGRAAYWQDVYLIKGKYRLRVDIKLSGGCIANLLVNDGSMAIDSAESFKTVSVDFSADGNTRIHLLMQGTGEARFKNVQIIPLELKTNPAPVQNSPYIGEIVLPENPDLAEEYAAWELQRCIGKLTGYVPGLRGRDKTQPGISILLGGEPDYRLRRLNDESYRVAKTKNAIILQGNSPRSTLYAVYDFLKEQGCAWGFAGELGEQIPKVKYINLPKANRYETPDYDVRGYYIWPQHMLPDGGWMAPDLEAEMDWALRNRMNALWAAEVHDFGAHRGYSHLQTNNHSWAPFLNDEHPEWWPLVDGKRLRLHMSGRPNQLCVSNKQLRDAAVEKALAAFRDEPRLKIFALSPEDEPCWWCECENCRKLDADQGKGEWKPATDGTPNISMADRVINFVNEVAARVVKVYPDKQIEVYAYGSYRDAPKREKVHPSVLIKYTYWPRPPLNEKILETKAAGPLEAVRQLNGWKKAGTKHFGLYDYYNWIYPDAVTTEFFQAADMLRTLNKKWGFKHALGETESGTFPAMMMYNLRAALLWNVDTDYREFMHKMCTDFYGPAAETIYEYYVALDDIILKSDKWKDPDWSYLNFSDYTVEDCISLGVILSRAEAKCKGIQPYESRIEIARFGHDSLYYAVAQSSETTLSAEQKLLAKAGFERAKNTMRKYGFGTNGVGIGVLENFYLPIRVKETIMALPVEWSFKTDAADAGIDAKWYAGKTDDSWQPIRTDKDWTIQGHNYHGAAWYALDLSIPENTAQKMDANKGKLSLYFGAVDGAVDVFLNGVKIGEQQTAVDWMWDKSFTIQIPESFDPRADNWLFVRVKKNNYAAGIWKPVSIVIE